MNGRIACPITMADPLRKKPREHPCIWSVIVFFQAMLFNFPPLTNMSDTDYSIKERVDTMYPMEVLFQLEKGKSQDIIRKQISRHKEVDRYEFENWNSDRNARYDVIIGDGLVCVSRSEKVSAPLLRAGR